MRTFSSQSLMNSHPYKLAETLQSQGLSRGWAVWNRHKEVVEVSHPSLSPLQTFLENDQVDFLKHEAMFFEVGPRSKALMGAFIWNTRRGQGCGGIRLRGYENVEEYIRDGMRLAIGMGRKSALAGLWAGGAKGVIAQPDGDHHKDSLYREKLFKDYGDFLSSLRGCYVAAEDVGLNVHDCDIVFSRSRFMTCISPQLGGSGNPSVPTAAGVAAAMGATVDYLGLSTDPSLPLSGLRVAVQGLGNVGSPLIQNLLDGGASYIIGSDVSKEKVSAAEENFKQYGSRVSFRLSPPGDNSILFEKVDVVAPCGFGSILNPQTIPLLNCKVICGAANNQLSDPFNGDQSIADRGITYVPDFVANRMGIVNCANETYGRVGKLGDHLDDPAISRHLGKEWENSVFQITRSVLKMAEENGCTPGQAGNQLADDYAAQEHPIWGHRSQEIIDSLLRDGWANPNPQ